MDRGNFRDWYTVVNYRSRRAELVAGGIKCKKFSQLEFLLREGV